MANVFEVRDLKVWFPVKRGIFAHTTGWVKAVDGVSFDLREGETLGMVGESGCGKSTTARAVLGLVRLREGSISFAGKRIEDWNMRDYHRKVQVVFQDPMASLNPRHTIRDILTEGMVFHGLVKKGEDRDAAVELLKEVGLSSDILDRYPHEFSGGQRQRICIARAIALRPRVLICDEAVSALDLSIRAQILDLLGELKQKLSLSILFITHDLGVVQHLADRVLVMNRGRIVEQGSCEDVLRRPQDEYTRYLMASVPKIGKPLV